MSYEFVPVIESPTIPEHWSLRATRIYEVPFFAPVLVPRGSLIADANGGVRAQIYIDANDLFIPEDKASFPKDSPATAVMHVKHPEHGVDGYLADLRYYEDLTRRAVTGDVSHEDQEQNEHCKTQALLGSVCLGMTVGTLEIRSQFADLPQIQNDFRTLLSYIDTLRAKKAATVSTIGRLDIPAKDLRPLFLSSPSDPSD